MNQTTIVNLTLGFFAATCAITAIWFLGIPGAVARYRGSPRAGAICALGYFGGLLFLIGWIAALVWALAEPVRVKPKSAFGFWLGMLAPPLILPAYGAWAWYVFVILKIH